MTGLWRWTAFALLLLLAIGAAIRPQLDPRLAYVYGVVAGGAALLIILVGLEDRHS